MKNIQTTTADINKFVASIYSTGKTASEHFDMTWNSLSKLEQQVPEITCKTLDRDNKTA